MKAKVLVDVSLGHKSSGFAGIPQDSRLLFRHLAHSKELEASGLIFSRKQGNSFSFKENFKGEATAVFLGSYLMGDDVDVVAPLYIRIINKIFPVLGKFLTRYLDGRISQFGIDNIEMEHFSDIIWRSFFADTLSPTDMGVLEKKFYWSGIAHSRIISSVLRNLPRPSLDTNGFDFVVFQDSQNIEVHPNTQKIIRYHDAMPVFASDTFSNQHHTLSHYRLIKICEDDSIFVCNSDSSRSDLEKISKKAADNAHVIPYFIPEMKKEDTSFEILRQICLNRISDSTMQDINSSSETVDKWFRVSNQNKIPKFLMMLCTIEPRKNHLKLLEAWMKLRYRTGEDIKLMIVGKPGWGYKKILSAMEVFVKSGDLLHLENVAQTELPYLYSAASCFVFPSFAEGFGIPPSEAMQCGCPVILSDIPAHRYSAGDGALFFNPYDIDDMSNTMEKVLCGNNKKLLSDLKQKGYSNVKRFSHDAVMPQWEEMFNKYYTKNKK